MAGPTMKSMHINNRFSNNYHFIHKTANYLFIRRTHKYCRYWILGYETIDHSQLILYTLKNKNNSKVESQFTVQFYLLFIFRLNEAIQKLHNLNMHKSISKATYLRERVHI